MKTLFKPVLAAGLMLTASAAPMLAAPAVAQDARGIGVVSLPAVIANSNAYRTAEQQRQTTYQAQISQAESRRQQIEAQLTPMIQAFNTARQGANPDQQALQQQAAQIQQIEQAGQRELQTILAPVALSRAYVTEQIEDRLDEAVQAAAAKRNVTLILDATSGQVIFAGAQHNLTQDVLNELNTLVPSVQITPPEGWVPREIRQQQQAAAQAAQAQQAAQPQQPTGR
ncbi:OmpH family outer membrane protein [Pelagerythrobacter marinus]|jgi:Skp family chaperone for outer membrane proteins|uniref:OmpH family outer membrane protein n=1 Tax=Pelagerythrobacter marinus TaxID=538382 RepID=A0ABW9UTA6_9SPHN|nr:OmpH family outer membrane protein [Pelagerythrobacter marinus]MEC9066245.1 OmpH family outer membrane protein [Pseudomonadota bacterium]MXO68081.1 OmpH family outer membrane protein [Pelagerythrobacter marinus]USA40759.1 OmpH family outer membrane protein [Pelagerythrobacter marinus]WPZ08068.1 OmpH family outer membrane protein [Pelagerythrobacter marinus]